MVNFMHLLIMLLIILFSANSFAESGSKKIIIGETVHVCGVSSKSMEWGPPNFGEIPKTDSKFEVWKLAVDSPGLLISENEVDTRVSTIQLFVDRFDKDTSNIRLVSGQHICADGKVWAASSQGDVLPFGLDVVAVRPK